MVMQTDAQRIAKDSPDEFQFLMSMRGRYIISQALHYGIQALESVTPDVMQEKSNIQDMKYLRDSFFNFPGGWNVDLSMNQGLSEANGENA